MTAAVAADANAAALVKNVLRGRLDMEGSSRQATWGNLTAVVAILARPLQVRSRDQCKSPIRKSSLTETPARVQGPLRHNRCAQDQSDGLADESLSHYLCALFDFV